MTDAVVDNPERRRYEMQVGGEIAFADYARRDGTLLIQHVETPPDLRGGGVAARLMEGIVAHARAEGFRITPLCSYAVAWMRRHPEHADLTA